MRPSPDRIFDYREFPVLYVDDEPENLRIFELTFRREFSILTAPSGEAGLELLNRRPVALVLSDQRMPGMTGVDFLGRARHLDPKTLRILVSAYGDAATLQSAINRGSIYRFVPKPWTPEDMRLTLRRGVEVYALEREREELLRELTLLNHVSRSISQELALGPLVDLLLETMTDEFGYDAAGVLFCDPSETRLEWAGFAPGDAAVDDLLRDLPLTGAAAPSFLRRLRSGESQVLSVQDALGLEAPVRRWVTEVAAEETLVVPILGKQGAIGALCVDNRRGGKGFGAGDRTLLEGLANQAAVAIQNARLVEDLRRSREQILRADRLGTLGTLAAGLAHEINNPLVSVHTFLSMAPAKRQEEDPEFWGDYHGLAAAEVERIRRLVDTMRRLGHEGGGDAPREAVDAGELVAEVAKLVQREFGKAQVMLRVEHASDTPKLHAVRDHLHQLLLNLLLNAVHASPEGGEVRVRTSADASRGEVCLEVTDHGPGIPEEHLERIFDPFFTTKGPDQGSGLGLMICHRIVEDHGGVIEVCSREGEGASFRVRLPIGGERAAGAAA